METLLGWLAGLLSVILMVFATGCAQIPGASPTPTPAPNSGIYGQVLMGPMCPVVSPENQEKCKDQPLQATVLVKTQAGSIEVASFASDSQGMFRIALAPGTYLLDPQPKDSSPFPRGIPQTVTVPPDKFVKVTVQYDTGIR